MLTRAENKYHRARGRMPALEWTRAVVWIGKGPDNGHVWRPLSRLSIPGHFVAMWPLLPQAAVALSFFGLGGSHERATTSAYPRYIRRNPGDPSAPHSPSVRRAPLGIPGELSARAPSVGRSRHIQSG